MTTPRIEGSSPVVSSRELETETPAPAPQPEAKRLPPDAVEAYAATKAHDIEQEFDSFFGGMDSVEAQLTSLDGPELKRVLEELEKSGKLDLIINKMKPAERQDFIQHAIDNKLMERQNGQLVQKKPLPESMKWLIADMNAQGPNNKKEPFYNWSASSDGPVDALSRSQHNQIRSLQPGDSVKLHQKLSVTAQHTTLGAESATIISRDPDGKFRLSMDAKAYVGLEEHLGKFHAGGSVGVAGRVEYTFVTPFEAELAAVEFQKNAAAAAKQYGEPAAIEVRAQAAADLARHAIGPEKAKLLELRAGAEASLVARLELGGKEPRIVLKATSRGDASGGLAFHSPSFKAEAHALPTGHLEEKSELELKLPIKDPAAFRTAPLDYLAANGAKMLQKAELEFSASVEGTAGHHGVARELSFKTDAEHLGALAADLKERGLAGALMNLSKKTEVDYREKDVEVRHDGFKLGVDSREAGFDVNMGFERKAFKNERTLYKGSAYDLVVNR